MKNKKKLLLIPLFLVIAVLAVFAYRAYREYSRQITGEEWFLKQAEYMEEFETYADEMDNVMTLYLTGSIAPDDFMTHLSILQDELNVMYVAYKAEQNEHPVRTGTHNYVTKKGCEAVEDCFRICNDIIAMASENYEDIDALSYKYFAFHQDVIKDVAAYISSKECLEELQED